MKGYSKHYYNIEPSVLVCRVYIIEPIVTIQCGVLQCLVGRQGDLVRIVLGSATRPHSTPHHFKGSKTGLKILLELQACKLDGVVLLVADPPLANSSTSLIHNP